MSRRSRDRKASFCDEFFKVYLPNQSSQRMRVPPAFAKLLNGAIPNNAILRDLCGKFWHVGMEEAENGVFFMDGWQRFASDHSLEFGNFLVFTYQGDSAFDVKIFRNNGCMKEVALGAMNEGPSAAEKSNIHVKIEKESGEEQTSSKLSRKASEEEQISPKLNRNCKRKYAEVAMKRFEKHEVAGSNVESRRKSQRIASKTIEQLGAFETSNFSLQKNPIFITSVRSSAPCRLNVPRKWLVDNCIKMEPEMLLRDDNGKLWPVKVTYCRDGGVSFGKGWWEFLDHNKVAVRDQCGFEFVLRRGGRIRREIQVHIVRAEDK